MGRSHSLALLLWLAAATSGAQTLSDAQKAYEAGDYAEAARIATKLASRSEDAATLSLLGRAQMRNKDYEDALESLQRALKLAPDSEGLHFYRGSILAKLGRDKEAERELEAELGNTPDSTHTLFTLALVERRLGKRNEAARSLQACLDWDPTDVQARKLLATVFLEMDRPNDALLHASELPAEEETAAILYNIGLVFYQAKQDAKAARALKLALRADKRHVKTWYLLGLTRLRQGNRPSARENFEKLLEIQSEGEEADQARKLLQSL